MSTILSSRPPSNGISQELNYPDVIPGVDIDRRVIVILVLIFQVSMVFVYPSMVTAIVPEADYDTGIVEIRSDTGQLRDTLTVWIADDSKKRLSGLRGIDSLKPGHGMIFVYSYERPRVFTMKGMSIPLDILFISSSKTISSVHPSRPGKKNIYSREAVQWVLEANYGWARKNNIQSGDVISVYSSRCTVPDKSNSLFC